MFRTAVLTTGWEVVEPQFNVAPVRPLEMMVFTVTGDRAFDKTTPRSTIVKAHQLKLRERLRTCKAFRGIQYTGVLGRRERYSV